MRLVSRELLAGHGYRNLCWLEGDAVGHVRQTLLYNNHAKNNSGLFLYLEIAMPIVILMLTIYHRRKSNAAS